MEKFVEALTSKLDVIDKFVWGPVMLVLLVGTGIFVTFRIGFLSWRNLPYALKSTLSKESRQRKRGEGDVSPFAALTTALAATIGTGNIVGVATAMVSGGAGALVWMELSAIFGLTTKFSECMLAIKYREVNENGEMSGGPMYTMKKAFKHKKIGAGLGWLFALFAVIASFGIGNLTQANSIATALNTTFDFKFTVVGVVLTILALVIIVGGIQSISRISSVVVPAMAIFYVVGGLIVIIGNIQNLPSGVIMIFKMAFSVKAVGGGLAGTITASMMGAMRYGVARGCFSNEAGMGSAPMVHATASVEHPVQQGFYGIFEVFMDTIVICTMTALVVMVTGTLTSSPELTGAQLTLQAFENALGAPGKYVLSVGLLLFAFTTILGWYWYAETAVTYLFGVWCKPIMKILWIAMIVIGAAGGQFIGAEGNQFLNNIWDISDTLNGLMALPNLIGLLILSVSLKRIVSDYDEKFGTPSDRILSPVQKVLVAKVQYIILGVIAVAMGMTAFFAYRQVFASLAIVLGLLTAYRRQTLLGFLAVILGIAAAAM